MLRLEPSDEVEGDGKEEWFEEVEEESDLARLEIPTTKASWFEKSSLGEFEEEILTGEELMRVEMDLARLRDGTAWTEAEFSPSDTTASDLPDSEI